MMEVDHISYIFGSFSRRRQSQDVSSPKRRSIETLPKIGHERSKSTPHTPKKTDSETARAKSVCILPEETKYKCFVCQKHFLEPRVLSCLHTFCTRCLEGIEDTDIMAVDWNHVSDDSSGSGNGSAGSGYVSDKQENSDNSYSPTNRFINCPTCSTRTELSSDGIAGLPPNYLVQHRMVLATLNAHTTKLLCDLCASDITASTRCSDCSISLCAKCADTHRRQKSTGNHEILSLEDARRRGITKVRRQVMCGNHPEKELSTFCSTCSQVICRDCMATSHRNHHHEPTGKAAKTHTTNIRIAVDRAKTIAEKSAATVTRLDATSKKLESHCIQIQSEIEKFMESYIRAVEQHHNNLFQQLHEARNEKLQIIEQHKYDMFGRSRDANDAVIFADELLRDGTDVEVLSFVKPIMKRLEMCYKLDSVQELKVSDSLQFLPEEVANNSGVLPPLYGVISTQIVSVKHCVMHLEGVQNLRVGRRGEAILETRDRSDNLLERGGEQVTAELRHRDAGTSRSIAVRVDDGKNGTYRLYFIPDVAGKLLLSVYVNSQPLKDSPFPIIVKTLRPHHGTFHCCSFCSSGGSKEAACGCGGNMPGGYRGCGHGHDGHPGRRHWSCCGNTLEHSECARTNSITHYQFTL